MKTKLSIFILILLLLCAGCSFDDGPEPDGIDFQKVSLSQLSAYGLLEDGTLFYDRIKKNNYVEYYTYHFDTEEKKQLGFIDDFFLCVPSATLINQHLYFYVARSLDETTLENALYDVDLKQSSLQRIEKPDPSIAGVGIFSLKDKPITLKNERQDSHVTTYIDVYDPTTKEWEKHLVNNFDENTKAGSAICVAYADNHSLYTIEDRYQDGTFDSYFVTYDENFQEINNFIIKGELKALLERGYRITV